MVVGPHSSNGHIPRQKSATPCVQCGKSANLAKSSPIAPRCVACTKQPKLCRDFFIRDRPLAKPTWTNRGTPEKIEVMAWRAANGFSIFHPDDKPDLEGTVPGILGIEAQWREVMSLPKLRARGYERHGDRWRARPTLDGERYGLKVYDTEQEASDAVMRFWRERLGLFAELGGSIKSFRLKRGPKFRIQMRRGTIIWPDERITARVPSADDPTPALSPIPKRRTRWRQKGLFD
jgi:hypothetical protein